MFFFIQKMHRKTKTKRFLLNRMFEEKSNVTELKHLKFHKILLKKITSGKANIFLR